MFVYVIKGSGKSRIVLFGNTCTVVGKWLDISRNEFTIQKIEPWFRVSLSVLLGQNKRKRKSQSSKIDAGTHTRLASCWIVNTRSK